MSTEGHQRAIDVAGSSLVNTLCNKCRHLFADLISAWYINQDWTTLFDGQRPWDTLIRVDEKLIDGADNRLAETCFLGLSQCRVNAELGCRTCDLISDSIYFQKPPDIGDEDKLFITTSSGNKWFEVRTTSSKLGRHDPHWTFDLFDTAQAAGQTRLESTGSSAAFDRIQKWKDECLHNHRECARNPCQLPDRILDVGPSQPILIESKGQYGSWAALSHSWGGQVALQTTTKTLASHLDGVPLAQLPATFRDAVDACRQLDLRYLWIDSLCIIQDDRGDWEEQAQQMGRIYNDAQFVIAAKTSVNSNAGMYRKQSVRVTDQDDSTGNLSDIHLRVSGGRGMGQPILDSRGWCLQESLLARATVIFWGPFTKWECAKGARSDDMETDTMPMTRLAYIRRYLLDGDPSPGLLWATMINEFTRRNLTFVDDRLAAIAGMAERLSQKGFHTGRYLSGVFEDDILHQISWNILPDKPVTRHTSNLPTWSWASNDQVIQWDCDLSSTELSKCDSFDTCTIKYVKPDPFSSLPPRLLGGFLQLTGRMKSCDCCPADNDSMASAIRIISRGLSPQPRPRAEHKDLTETYLDRKPTSNVWVFELTSYTGSPMDGDGVFLMLLEEVPEALDTYTRIGIVNCEGVMSVKDWSERSIKLV